MKLSICGQTCHLLPEKALFWQEEQLLILADLHLGKATCFRKHGLAIPEGEMQADLQRLLQLIDTLQPKKCLIAGDLIHAHQALCQETVQLFSHFLQEIKIDVDLVLGNHDRGLLSRLPKEWKLNIHLQGYLIPPFYFSHYPLPQQKWFVWAGHLHPKVEIKNRHDRLVLRCFQLLPNMGILPAFGTFVGGTFVKKKEDSQIFAIAGSNVVKI